MNLLKITFPLLLILCTGTVHAIQWYCWVVEGSIQVSGDPSDAKYKMLGYCKTTDTKKTYYLKGSAKYFYNAPYERGEASENLAVYSDPARTNKLGTVHTQAVCKKNPFISTYPGNCTVTNLNNTTGVYFFNGPYVPIMHTWAGDAHKQSGSGTGALVKGQPKDLKDWNPYAPTPEVGIVVTKPVHNQVIPAASGSFVLALSSHSRQRSWRVSANTPVSIQWERLVSNQQVQGDVAVPQNSYWTAVPGPTEVVWGNLPLQVAVPNQTGYYRVKALLTYKGKAYQSAERRFWVGKPPIGSQGIKVLPKTP